MKADLHSHLLPGMDDGAKNTKETAAQLAFLRKMGTRAVALTPHFYSDEQSMTRFLKRREESFRLLQTMPEAKDFSFSLGAEVFLTRDLFNEEDLSPLCYEGTNRILIELDGTEFTPFYRESLDRLIGEYGLRPILAHIDRFDFLSHHPERLLELERMGCLFQVNLSSFSGFFSFRRLCRLGKEGLIHFLGRDLHRRVPSCEEQEALEQKIKARVPHLMAQADENARKLIFHK